MHNFVLAFAVIFRDLCSGLCREIPIGSSQRARKGSLIFLMILSANRDLMDYGYRREKRYRLFVHKSIYYLQFVRDQNQELYSECCLFVAGTRKWGSTKNRLQ